MIAIPSPRPIDVDPNRNAVIFQPGDFDAPKINPIGDIDLDVTNVNKGSKGIVASGGILRGSDLLAFQAAGAQAAMLYSALVFRGPLAGALILREAERGDDRG